MFTIFSFQDFSHCPNSLFNIDGTLYFELSQLLLQEAERLGLNPSTKFLAKKYLDIYLALNSLSPPNKSILLIITCLRVATKFNEPRDFAEVYSIDVCLEQCSGCFSKQEFLSFELQLLSALKFKLKITSPYDFMIVQPLLPHLSCAMTLIHSAIDFSLTLPELRATSAEALFFGCLVYVCREKKETASSLRILEALTFKWEETISIANFLKATLDFLNGQ